MAQALARDPAAWAWIAVALLALLPLLPAMGIGAAAPERDPVRGEASPPAPVAGHPPAPSQS